MHFLKKQEHCITPSAPPLDEQPEEIYTIPSVSCEEPNCTSLFDAFSHVLQKCRDDYVLEYPETVTMDQPPILVCMLESTRSKRYSVGISCLDTESRQCGSCVRSRMYSNKYDPEMCSRDATTFACKLFKCKPEAVWANVIRSGITASVLYKHNVPLHWFTSAILSSGKSLYNVLIDLRTKRKHLKNGLFFDPIRISRIYSGSNTQTSLIAQIHDAVTKVSLDISSHINSRRKSIPEHGLLYCDFPRLGWEAEDLIALGTTYVFLYKIGLRDSAALDRLSKPCNIGQADWKTMGLTKGDLAHLQENTLHFV